jgi:hypothetical protein
MPERWGTYPDNVFHLPGAKREPAASGQDDHINEVKLKEEGGKLRLPPYVLITLGIALAAILLVIAGLLLMPG